MKRFEVMSKVFDSDGDVTESHTFNYDDGIEAYKKAVALIDSYLTMSFTLTEFDVTIWDFAEDAHSIFSSFDLY